MQLNNIWTAIMSGIIGIGAAISIFPIMETLVGMNDQTGKLFLMPMVAFVFLVCVFFNPLGALTQDDKGRGA